MNFKGIEIFGFKSFADRLEIRFDGGFTGIVGPNGCGKSNVADAIRWVLGEQAPSQLRGKCMQDVIFSGTDNRNSLSFCEVTLVFDNSKKVFSVNFDEVAITRKLFRSGDSEYLINNVPCRLKDITNMLKDTGLGRDGLSIIGQGKVEDIVSAKPGDRRKVFEEAAGIARLKARKRESELKLDRHRLNLERISLILDELEKQLGPLKRQAEDAKKYTELSADLKYHEINYYIYKYDNANDLKNEINLRIRGINEEIEEIRRRLNKASDDSARTMSDIGSYDDRLQSLLDEQTKLLVGIEKLAGEGKVYSERITNDKAAKLEIENTIERLQEEIRTKNQSVNTAHCDREQALRDIDSLNAELEVVLDKYLRVEEELIANESTAELTSQDIFLSLDKLTDIKSNMSKLIAERDGLIVQLQEIKDEQSESREKLDNILKDKDKYDKQIITVDNAIEGLKKGITKLKLEYNDSRLSLSEINRKVMELNNRKSSLDARCKVLQNAKNSYDSFQVAVKRVMQDKDNDPKLNNCIEGVVAELIKVPAEYEVAIETVLAGALQNIVTRTQEDAAYVIDYLKRNSYGRITFLPMNSFKSSLLDPVFRPALNECGVIGIASDLVATDKEYKGIVEGLLGKTVLVDTIDNGIRLSQKYRNGFRIVTLEGEVFSTTGSMAGGSRRSEKAELLSRERDIEEIKKQLDDTVKQHNKLQDESKKAAQRLEQILDEIRDIEEDIQKQEVTKATLNEKIIIAAKLYDDTIVNINLRDGKIQSIERRIYEINEQKKFIEKVEHETEQEKTSAGKKAQETKSLSDSKRQLRESLKNKQADLKLQVKDKESLVKTLEGDIIRLKEEIVLNEHNIKNLEVKLVEVIDRLNNSEQELNRIMLENSDNQEIAELKEKIDSVGKFKKSLQDELLELDFLKGELNHKLNDATSRQIREDSRLQKIDSDLANMETNIMEQYNLDYDTALLEKDPEYDSSKSQSEISKLKKAINALGTVNLNALNDYVEVGSRYEDLSSQKKDLIEAEEDLMQIIKELTDEMVTKFRTEFDKINQNFKVVFKELFGGGRAELILEEEEAEDPLEAGITIKAEPPGKKMQNISLLSGGERSLIAIGILFAILKTKPMPFCILDEIEAALDDSNVKVFATYLRRFSRETQFIVITHRKPTMELADSLYGVTMEEKGISKMVSVKLGEAIKSADIGKKSENIA